MLQKIWQSVVEFSRRPGLIEMLYAMWKERAAANRILDEVVSEAQELRAGMKDLTAQMATKSRTIERHIELSEMMLRDDGPGIHGPH